MTPVLYFLHLKTLDILLLIVNISVADDAFICNLKITFYMKILIFNSFLLLRWLKGGKTKVKNGLTSLSYLFTL